MEGGKSNKVKGERWRTFKIRWTLSEKTTGKEDRVRRRRRTIGDKQRRAIQGERR